MNTIGLDRCCAEILSFSIDDSGKLMIEVLLTVNDNQYAKSIELCFYILTLTNVNISGSPWMKKITSFKIDGSSIGLPIDDSLINENDSHSYNITLDNNSYFNIVATKFFSITKKEISRR